MSYLRPPSHEHTTLTNTKGASHQQVPIYTRISDTTTDRLLVNEDKASSSRKHIAYNLTIGKHQ